MPKFEFFLLKSLPVQKGNFQETACLLDRQDGKAVIDAACIDESTKNPYRLSISKKAQDINSYAN